VFIDGDQGGNNPDANTANKEKKITQKVRRLICSLVKGV
jgi:hypothetical protein